MHDQLIQFQHYFDKHNFKIKNHKLKQVLEKYNFYYIYHKRNFFLNTKTYENLKQSNFIVIDHFMSSKEKNAQVYFTIGFKETVIIIPQSLISCLYSYYEKIQSKCICFLSKTKYIFNQLIKTKFNTIEVDNNFNDELFNFNQQFEIIETKHPLITKIWYKIRSCISSYLLKFSYCKIKMDRINNFINLKESQYQIEMMNENDFIFLRNLGYGPVFRVDLVYHIEKEELFVLKKENLQYQDDEFQKLFKREIDNYSFLRYPFLPRCIGQISQNCMVIEYINGKTLEYIDKIQLDYNDKLLIIFELMIVLKYLHEKDYIYRDLKPNNIMIDKKKDIVLIDFDRMINKDFISQENHYSNNFSSEFVAPEVNFGYLSNKCDIYSLGKIIQYIMESDTNDFVNDCVLENIYKKCINSNPILRPQISEILEEFYHQYVFLYENENLKIFYSIFQQYHLNNIFMTKELVNIYRLGGKYLINEDYNNAIYYFTILAEKDHSDSQWILGMIYSDNSYYYYNIHKAIYYFSLAAKKNHIDSQYQLGIIYYDNKYTVKDIHKAILYFQLAANQNNKEAQYYLAEIYMKGQDVKQDIKKGLYFLTLAADNGDSLAQFNLGLISYNGIYVIRDINKAIHYLKLSAQQNVLDAYYILGIIYYDGKYVDMDISLALYYLSYAADKNNSNAQFALGCIYSDCPYVQRNMNKAIHYYSLSAIQNNAEAQYNLGFAYLKGDKVKFDIEKAIKYFTLAANQKEPMSQFYLGYFYLNGIYVEKNISKSLSLFLDSANSGFDRSNFFLGFLYHEGKNVKQDIAKSIHYYKEASSFNNQYAKNNLGIIYKNSFSNEINENIGYAIEYLKEAIKRNKNILAMYNLANIYIYKYKNESTVKKAIKLLIESTILGFKPSLELLCLILIKELGLKMELIKKEVAKYTNKSKDILDKIITTINTLELYLPITFEYLYQEYQTIDFLYVNSFQMILSKQINLCQNDQNYDDLKLKNITEDFYKGFGLTCFN